MSGKIKKTIKIILLTMLGCVVLISGTILFYYLFLFRNPNPISFFVPADCNLFVSLHKPADSLPILENYIPAKERENLYSKIGISSIEQRTFLLGEDIAVFKRGSAYGICAKITFPAKCILPFLGLLIKGEVVEEEIGGNRVMKITAGEQEFYIASKWDVITVTWDKDLAGDTAELLNRRPVIKPLCLSDQFKELSRTDHASSLVYAAGPFIPEENILSKEINTITAAGGAFAVDPESIKGNIQLLGDFTKYPSSPFPDFQKAFMTVSLPCNIQKIWLDYCLAVQKRETQYNSFKVILTSEIFDPFVKTVNSRLFLYAFEEKEKSIYPSAVFCIETSKRFSDDQLEILFREFASKVQKLHLERIKRSRKQKFTYTVKSIQQQGTSIHYIDINPKVILNFTPGFCIYGNFVLIATDHTDIIPVLNHIKSGGDQALGKGYYLRIKDSGLKTLLTYLKRSLSDPERRKRVENEIQFSKSIEKLDMIEKYAGEIDGGIVREKDNTRIRTLEFKIRKQGSEDRRQRTENRDQE
jgi:hypothetical protein